MSAAVLQQIDALWKSIMKRRRYEMVLNEDVKNVVLN